MGAEETARRVRAIWGYSLLDQDDLAREAGIHKDRLRAIIARTNPAEASTAELLELARVAEIPPSFAAVGFDDYNEETEIKKLWAEVATLKEQVAPAGDLGQTAIASTRQVRGRGDRCRHRGRLDRRRSPRSGLRTGSRLPVLAAVRLQCVAGGRLAHCAPSRDHRGRA